MRKVIYIAGPISNDPDYKRKFEAAKQGLEREGYIVLYSHWMPWGLEHNEYMTMCLPMVEVADVIYLLTGWEYSTGAKMEYNRAKELGKEIKYQCERITKNQGQQRNCT